MAQFAPPPTWALPVLVDEKSGRTQFNPIWLDWFIQLTGIVNAGGGTTPAEHNALTGLQGGTPGSPGERYHTTQAQNTAIASFITTLAGTTYTPTLTSVANVSATTAFQSQYLRVGATIGVSGKLDCTPTAEVTLTKVGISLPVASNFGADEDCAGVSWLGGAVVADTANDRAELQWIPGDTGSHTLRYVFIYQVI